MADHGTRQSYADGCRCPGCKAAQSKYMREYKARKAGADIKVAPQGRPRRDATVTKLPTAVQAQGAPAVGPNEQATLDELATLTSSDTRKAAAQVALTMARIMDNPLEPGPSKKGAGQLLVSILDDLRKGSARRKGRLASVQEMTRSATG